LSTRKGRRQQGPKGQAKRQLTAALPSQEPWLLSVLAPIQSAQHQDKQQRPRHSSRRGLCLLHLVVRRRSELRGGIVMSRGVCRPARTSAMLTMSTAQLGAMVLPRNVAGSNTCGSEESSRFHTSHSADLVWPTLTGNNLEGLQPKAKASFVLRHLELVAPEHPEDWGEDDTGEDGQDNKAHCRDVDEVRS